MRQLYLNLKRIKGKRCAKEIFESDWKMRQYWIMASQRSWNTVFFHVKDSNEMKVVKQKTLLTCLLLSNCDMDYWCYVCNLHRCKLTYYFSLLAVCSIAWDCGCVDIACLFVNLLYWSSVFLPFLVRQETTIMVILPHSACESCKQLETDAFCLSRACFFASGFLDTCLGHPSLVSKKKEDRPWGSTILFGCLQGHVNLKTVA